MASGQFSHCRSMKSMRLRLRVLSNPAMVAFIAKKQFEMFWEYFLK